MKILIYDEEGSLREGVKKAAKRKCFLLSKILYELAKKKSQFLL